MPSTRSVSAVALAAATLIFSSVASAAAPLPKAASAYSTGSAKGGVSLTLVTGPSSTQIEQGAAAVGSQYALSGGSVQCKKAKKGPGFHGVPFAVFGFPATTLKVSHGKYGFSKKVRQPNTQPLGSTSKAFTLKLKITGTVSSSSLITGTVSASGGPCSTKKPVKYRAKLDPKLPVAPGQ